MSARVPRSGQAALTPLLDTLFLLLFALLATSESRDAARQEVQVSLPSLESDGSTDLTEDDVPLSLEIDALGAVRVGDSGARGEAGSFAGPAELRAWLRGQEPGRPMEIRADSDARHAVVLEVLHELQELGFLNVRFVATAHDSVDQGALGTSSGARWGRSGR